MLHNRRDQLPKTWQMFVYNDHNMIVRRQRLPESRESDRPFQDIADRLRRVVQTGRR